MKAVRIVGGGLTGILAAFEAHRLGCRDIILCERFEALGGVSLPRKEYGLELRDGCVYFGPRGDPIRTLLESHGVAFDDFENRFSSISPGGVVLQDFGGPALACDDLALTAPAGQTLADRIGAYPETIAREARRYCEWHLGMSALDEVHESAAIPLAINRIYPAGADLELLTELKRGDALYDELYGIPRALWGHQRNVVACVPRGGFTTMFETCRRALEKIGVVVCDTSLVSPRQALHEHRDGDVLVWAANPTPLFKAIGLATPPLLKKTFATYVFKARYAGPLPYYVQNFTAQGPVFRIYLYESGGQTLVTAECVTECGDRELRDEIETLKAGLEGVLTLGECVFANVAPRWIYHSTASIEGLRDLRAAFAARLRTDFVAGAWEPYAKGEKFTELCAALELCAGRAAAVA